MNDPRPTRGRTGSRRGAPRGGRLRAAALAGVFLFGLGCESEEPLSATLVDRDSWVQISSSDDPMGAHVSPDAPCDSTTGAFSSIRGFEIHTDDCSYYAGVQPSLTPLSKGELFTVVFSHSALYNATGPAQAHAALSIDGDVVWENYIDIPVFRADYEDEFEVGREYAEGVPVMLHVHNHGAGGTNEYLLRTVARTE